MIVTILGARPQFVKAAVLSKAFKLAKIEEEIIHTGQHYDPNMSDVFFQQLGLPGVVKNLHIGSGHHGAQTGAILTGIENYLLERRARIKAVLVYGDTNSTLAGALAAVKLHIPIIHVEAGLRSFNKRMPEEVNRIMTDHISDVLFCSSELGKAQLEKEGIKEGVHVVGDIMYDAVNIFLKVAEQNKQATTLPKEKYNLITIHRPANTDNSSVLQDILYGLGKIDCLCIWPVHPRNKKHIKSLDIPSNVRLIEPLSYLDMLLHVKNAHKIITDSGGLQKEAYWLKVPCITIRPQTEWVETLENNWNQLSAPTADAMMACYQLNPKPSSWKSLYGTGTAAKKIIAIIQATI